MLYDRYEPKHYAEAHRESCPYCRRQPESWQYIQNEKVCPHCGTRVLVSAAAPLKTAAVSSSPR
jgi:DNA-directed RNA polymerase subunit RPC12/RpoP